MLSLNILWIKKKCKFTYYMQPTRANFHHNKNIGFEFWVRSMTSTFKRYSHRYFALKILTIVSVFARVKKTCFWFNVFISSSNVVFLFSTGQECWTRHKQQCRTYCDFGFTALRNYVDSCAWICSLPPKSWTNSMCKTSIRLPSGRNKLYDYQRLLPQEISQNTERILKYLLHHHVGIHPANISYWLLIYLVCGVSFSPVDSHNIPGN